MVLRAVPAVVISGLVIVTASSVAQAEITRDGYFSVLYANTIFGTTTMGRPATTTR